MACPWNLG